MTFQNSVLWSTEKMTKKRQINEKMLPSAGIEQISVFIIICNGAALLSNRNTLAIRNARRTPNPGTLFVVSSSLAEQKNWPEAKSTAIVTLDRKTIARSVLFHF